MIFSLFHYFFKPIIAIMNSYLAALTEPFSRAAIGAQVPDMYSFPTETQMVRAIFTLGCDSNGNLDFVVTPSLFQTILCACPLTGASPNNSIANIGGVFCQDFTPNSGVLTRLAPVSSPTLSLNVQSWIASGVVTPETVYEQMQRYRIVGMGCRISSLTAPLNQTGKLVMASFPSPRLSFPSNLAGHTGAVATTASNASFATVCQWLDLPWPDASGYSTSEILNVPEAKSITVADLCVNGSIQWVNKPTATGNVAFRDSFNDIVVSNALTLGEVLQGAAPAGGVSYSYTLTGATGSIGVNYLTGVVAGVVNGLPPAGAVLTGGTGVPGTFAAGAVVVGYNAAQTIVYLSTLSLAITASATYTFTLTLPFVSATGDAVIDPDYFRVDGWETLMVRGTQMGNVVNENTISVEVIFHVEGCPYVSGAVGAFINGGEAPPVDPIGYLEAIQAASEMPFFTRVNDGNADIVGRKRSLV